MTESLDTNGVAPGSGYVGSSDVQPLTREELDTFKVEMHGIKIEIENMLNRIAVAKHEIFDAIERSREGAGEP